MEVRYGESTITDGYVNIVSAFLFMQPLMQPLLYLAWVNLNRFGKTFGKNLNYLIAVFR